VWGIGILALLLSISSQFHSFTKPNSIMKITDSSFAILLLSLSASAAAPMSTLPDGGQRHQLQAFTTASNTRGGGTQMLQDATGGEPLSVNDSSRWNPRTMAIFSYQCLETASLVSDALVLCRVILMFAITSYLALLTLRFLYIQTQVQLS
jgi:hypothetical protein